MRLQYTLTPTLNQIWPTDSWSRIHIENLCNRLGVSFNLVPTTMGTQAYQFRYEDFRIISEELKHYNV